MNADQCLTFEASDQEAEEWESSVSRFLVRCG